LRYQWDALSNLKSLILPQGQVLNYQRYGSGHVHGMTLDQRDNVRQFPETHRMLPLGASFAALALLH
jgi:hypothetical protein